MSSKEGVRQTHKVKMKKERKKETEQVGEVSCVVRNTEKESCVANVQVSRGHRHVTIQIKMRRIKAQKTQYLQEQQSAHISKCMGHAIAT